MRTSTTHATSMLFALVLSTGIVTATTGIDYAAPASVARADLAPSLSAIHAKKTKVR
jgi:hypothetical protein